jgi:Predicted esterase of the alpha-beta hydrolase superfamily
MSELKSHKPHQLGMALSGGGAKGFVHLGVFKLLEECNLKPDIISGTSAGALAGVLYADGYTSDEIKEIFKGKEFSEFARIRIPKAGLFDMSRMKSFLDQHLRAKRIEDLKIPLVIIATDLDRGISREFRQGPIKEAVMASCCVPIIFSPVEIDGVHYVDGGLFRNFPVSNIRKECKKVIGVNASPLIPLKYKQTIRHIAERSYHYMFQANTMEDRLLCDLLIETESAGEYKLFDLENVDRIAQIGYDAALNAFNNKIEDSKFDLLVKAVTGKISHYSQMENHYPL